MGMVDVSHKLVTKRAASAQARIIFTPKAFKIFMAKGSPKGNVLETAKIAGILAAKNTPAIIPLCHPLNLEKISISFEIIKSRHAIRVISEILSSGKTGVEMEALCAVSAACLTIYDMMKYTGQGITITDMLLLKKSGGKSGVYTY